jgi:tRNA1(Val) A37 N6-methylase TrmN6
VDLGAGIGAAGLALATRVGGLDLVFVDLDRRLAELARNNAMGNGIAAESIVLDLTSPPDAFTAVGLMPDSVDVVMMNPPFNNPARHPGSPDRAREAAHVATPSTLEDFVHAARRMLKSKGVLTMIWRADGLADVLSALGRGFGSVAILPVHGDAAKPAIRVLVRAVKGGRAPTQLLPALLLNDQSAVSKKKLDAVLEGRDVLLPALL